MATIGFVGLGAMGSRFVRRLLDGNTVCGTNRTPAKAAGLVERGMIWRETPRHVTRPVDVVFTMVSDDAALRAVHEGPDGILAGLRHGQIVVDMSTVGPDTVAELADRVESRGAHMVSAPVSGSVPAAAEGSLVILAGGPFGAVTAIEPLLYRLGRQVAYVGTRTQALTLKLAMNVALANQVLAFSEALMLAEKAGIDPEQAASVMTDSPIGSPALRTRAPMALHLPHRAWFDLRAMRKDLRLATEAAAGLGMHMACATAVSNAVDLAVDHGYANRDLAGLYAALHGRIATDADYSGSRP
ncbi:NAD(P)-dependent oxidoreductase [Nocardia sp. CA2R105]|uniref:NAD(P)-dependent oxidoreductase n=1 Tax=Nocardia coffeae TaxID=2873381 RepID=UPI001CA64B85|nr:NAD(P)-dependent oxidoreductase [Nocardia coffeae]MBY8861967.1 NAD(P)-dependent oxidoreductase [Nocardia coffeae]